MEQPQPEVLKYLSGEISFEKWLETQQDDQQMGYNYYPSHGYSDKFSEVADAESSSIFSSWGSAFTGATGQVPEDDTYTEDSEDEDGDFESDFDGMKSKIFIFYNPKSS